MHHLLLFLHVLVPRDISDTSPPVAGTRLVEISALVGVFVPWVAQLTKQDGLSQRWNALIALLTCAVAAVVTCLVAGQFNLHDLVGSLVAVYTVAVATYHGLWQHVSLLKKLKRTSSVVKKPTPHSNQPPLA